ncbi:M9 family metallopeptidase [Paucibacter sp. B2R-40]|uniref:M9 family metallopeptidase n=1 Tax=Paucibacter sp. B2R-40 TaxID=2893554 RepID=UPI0021E492FB|nr:M9 family metallopeptidase [Paucibacter sp. B2R-40]MCV2355278.1 M9 family metallopeptidase [Paucibacter sp. B2R-40]
MSSLKLAPGGQFLTQWLSATGAALLLCVYAQAAPSTEQAHSAIAAQQRQNLLPNDPGAPRPGSHAARLGVHPAQLPLRRADDAVAQRQRIGEAPTVTDASSLPASAQAALAVQNGSTMRQLAAGAAAPLACSGTDFVGKSGAALIAFIDAADLRGCMYQLYYGSATDYATVFSDANIITVSKTLKARAEQYPGNNSNKAMNLLSFLRTAGYWSYLSVYGDAANGIPAGSRVMMNTALGALKQLIASPRFYDSTEDNAYFVSEVFKTVSSGFARAYAPAAKRWLDQVQPATTKIGYWTNDAILSAMNVLYYGEYQADYRAAVAADGSYAQTLSAFLSRNLSLLGSNESYHLANAMGELLRFVQYPALSAPTRSLGLSQMAHFPVTDDNTIDVWMRAASMVDQYDASNCGLYGTCNGYETVAQLKLPIRYACGSQYTIRAQAMTPAQLAGSCASISHQTAYFHALMGTDAEHPVADDHNETLELVVFDSANQYKRFSGYLFGNDTNNGGMYLEGYPSEPGNQARFLAHRADWLGEFEIWNLNHEFTHYLDGRYNMRGNFGDYPLELGDGAVANSAVWWIEGVAEYVSYSYRRAYYADATSRAQTAPLPLSELLRNTYSSGQTRVYNWGYLAVRYMLERQLEQDGAFLPKMRAGDYAAYSEQISALGTSLDADFSHWLSQCVGGGDIASSTCLSQRASTLPLLTPNALGECNLSASNRLANGCARSLTPGSVMQFAIPSSSWAQSIFTLSGVSGSADIYVRADGWASPSNYGDMASSSGGKVSVKVPTGSSGWSYVTVVPRSGFTKATLRGMFSELPFAAASKPGKSKVAPGQTSASH